MLLLTAREEARDVLERHEGDVEAVAEADEAGCLVGGVDVKHAGKERGLVGDDAHGAAAQAGKAHDDVLGKVGHHLEEVLVVDHRLDDVLDVVGHVRVFGHDRLQAFVLAVGVIGARTQGGLLHVVRRKEAEQLADAHERLLLGVAQEVGHAAAAAVGVGTAKLFLVHLFVGHCLHHVRTGDEHVALLLHHEDEVGQCGRVACAAGTGTEDG